MAVPAVRLAVVSLYCACLLSTGNCEEHTEVGPLQQVGQLLSSSRQGNSATHSATSLQVAPPPSKPGSSVAAVLGNLLRPAVPLQNSSPAAANTAHGVQSTIHTLPSIRTSLTQLFGSIANPRAPAPAPAPAPAVGAALLNAVGEQLNRTLGSALAGAARGAESIVNPFRRAPPVASTPLQAALGNGTRQSAYLWGNAAHSGSGLSAPRLGSRNTTAPWLPILARVLSVGGGAAAHAEPASSSVAHPDASLPGPSSTPGHVTGAGGRSVAPAPSLTAILGRLARDAAATAAEPIHNLSSSAVQHRPPTPSAQSVTGPVRALAQQPAPLIPMLSNPLGTAGALHGGVGGGAGAALTASSLSTAAAARLAAGAAGAALGGVGAAASGPGGAVTGAAVGPAGAVASMPGAAARLAGGAAAAVMPPGEYVAGAAGSVANRTGDAARAVAGGVMGAARAADAVVASLPIATARLAGGIVANIALLGGEAASALGSAGQDVGTGVRDAVITVTDAAEGAGRAVGSIPGTAARLAAAMVAPLGNQPALAVEGAPPGSNGMPSPVSPVVLTPPASAVPGPVSPVLTPPASAVPGPVSPVLTPPASAVPGPAIPLLTPPAGAVPAIGSGLLFNSAGAPTSPSLTPPSPEPPASAGGMDPALPATGGIGAAADLPESTVPADGLLTGLSAGVLAASLLPDLATSGITTGVTVQNEVSGLISTAQNGGLQALLPQLFSDIQSFAVGPNITNFGGSTVASAVSDTVHLLRELPGLLSSGDSSEIGQVSQAVLQSISSMCSGQGTQLPAKESPSCSGALVTLSLVPWSCLLDTSNNVLSCTPAYLLLTKTADACTLLGLSGGALAGMACGIQKRFGIPSSSMLGGQQFYLMVSDIVSGLEAAAGSPSVSPAAAPSPSPAPSADSFEASWSKVARAFNNLIKG